MYTDRSQKAMAFHKQGYNCAQSVAMAFADVYDMSEAQMARTMAAFGSGMAGLKGTCGAVSALVMLAGLDQSSTHGTPGSSRANILAKQLIQSFVDRCGSAICGVLLGSNQSTLLYNAAQVDTGQTCPLGCNAKVGVAAEIFAQYLDNRH